MLAPAMASAQEKNPFTDSWFWGANGGAAFLNTSVHRYTAPAFGADWLITRTNYALNIGLDQAYFSAVSTVDDAPTRGVVRQVDIRDMRRFSIAMDIFPVVWKQSIRPYGGMGYSLNYVVSAASQGNQFANPSARDTVLARIQSAKSRGSIIGTVGVQVDIRRWAPFFQASFMPTQGAKADFLINGAGFTYYLEAGIRYNFGTSIEKM